jgi:hypothetical protein
MLATWYSALKSQGVDLEIVFISSDKDEESVSNRTAHPFLLVVF